MPVRPRYVERTSSPKVLASFMASMMSWSTPIETFTVCDLFAPMVEEDVDVVVLGGGFDDIRIVEQAAGLRRDVVLESLPWCAV